MLPLDDPRWSSLYGYGGEPVPDLLRRLALGDGSAVWFLYDAICHQGTASQAAIAAFPHLVALGDQPWLLELLTQVTQDIGLGAPCSADDPLEHAVLEAMPVAVERLTRHLCAVDDLHAIRMIAAIAAVSDAPLPLARAVADRIDLDGHIVNMDCERCAYPWEVDTTELREVGRASLRAGVAPTPLARLALDSGHDALAELFIGLQASHCGSCGDGVFGAPSAPPPEAQGEDPAPSDRSLVAFLASEHGVGIDVMVAALLEALTAEASARGAATPTAAWVADRLVLREGDGALDVDSLLDAATDRLGSGR